MNSYRSNLATPPSHRASKDSLRRHRGALLGFLSLIVPITSAACAVDTGPVDPEPQPVNSGPGPATTSTGQANAAPPGTHVPGPRTTPGEPEHRRRRTGEMFMTINGKTTYVGAGSDSGDSEAILYADFEPNAARTLSVTFPSQVGSFAKSTPVSTTLNLFDEYGVRVEYEVASCDGVVVYTCASAGVDAQSIAKLGEDCDPSLTVIDTSGRFAGTFSGTLVAIQEPGRECPADYPRRWWVQRATRDESLQAVMQVAASDRAWQRRDADRAELPTVTRREHLLMRFEQGKRASAPLDEGEIHSPAALPDVKGPSPISGHNGEIQIGFGSAKVVSSGRIAMDDSVADLYELEGFGTVGCARATGPFAIVVIRSRRNPARSRETGEVAQEHDIGTKPHLACSYTPSSAHVK